MEAAGKVALVTGGNRGLGREVVRQLAARGMTVLLCARSQADADAAAAAMAELPGRVIALQLDVTRQDDIDQVAAFVGREFGQLDILINNAAILTEPFDGKATVSDFGAIAKNFETNLFGPWRMLQAFAPAMRARGAGRIVNVSSGVSRSGNTKIGLPIYRTSKAGLNVLTQVLAAEMQGSGVLVNAVCPGLITTRTDIPGGRTVEVAGNGVVFVATLPDDGPTGIFFKDCEPLPW